MYATTPPRAPVTGPSRPHRSLCPTPVVTQLRTVIAAEHGFDLAALRARPAAPVTAPVWLDLLGPGGSGGAAPIRTAADALDRVDALARDLIRRMRARGWDEGAAPEAVTSVLAASVPAAEAVLLRAARSRRT